MSVFTVPRLILISFALLLSISAQANNVRSGEYELVVKRSIKGLPSGIGSLEWRECLTQANPIPTQYLQASNCDVLESHMVYHTLHYKLSCYTDKGTFTNEGKLRFGNFRLDGKSKSDTGDVAGQTMVVRYKFEGRRIGDCR